MLIIGIVTVIFIAIISIIFSSISKNSEIKLENLYISDIDVQNVGDGVYNGKYSIFPVSVELDVTVKEGRITDINIIKHSNGKGSSAESILDDVILNQSAHVDVITGATMSSKVILKAIDVAINGD